MRQILGLWVCGLISIPAQSASTLVWVESQEAGSAALAEEIQALAGPTELLRILTGRQAASDLGGQALNAARLAWRQVRLDTVTATLDQAEGAFLSQPRRGDALRLAEVYSYRAATQMMNFQTKEARNTLRGAAVLGQKSLPSDLINTLSDIWNQLAALPQLKVEISLRTAPGARLWLNGKPWDQTTSPRVLPGRHLIGTTQPGHHPVWQWLDVGESGGRAVLLPQAPSQLAPVSSQLRAAAAGNRGAADAARRTLGVDGLVLCTLKLVVSRYDARCSLYSAAVQPSTAVASFLPGEPLAAHAARIWQGLSTAQTLTIRPGDLSGPGAHKSNTLAWSGIIIGSSSLLISGWATLQTRALHQEFRSTAQNNLELPTLQKEGEKHALIADASLGLGLVFNAIGTYLLLRTAKQNRAVDALTGASR
jgi:hypothetical protein